MKEINVKKKGADLTKPKPTTLDVRRVSLEKDPSQADSSLQFLIILLGRSFGLSVEEILGLFTNQNKYLAHLLVKGTNGEFQGVSLFYSLLMRYRENLINFMTKDQKDAESCLYAVKPGLICKEEAVAKLAINLFSQLPHLYEWFTNDKGRGANTLLLGIKRHPKLSNQYCQLMLKIIQN